MTLAPNRPIAAAMAVLFEQGRILLVRRANPPDAGLWGFPGGKIEFGESVHAAALRELNEETGLTAEAVDIVTVVDVFERAGMGTGPHDAGKLTRQFVLIAVLCRHPAGEARPADDALEARWFSPDELEAGGIPMSREVLRIVRLAAGRANP